jgi:hypothetical protein
MELAVLTNCLGLAGNLSQHTAAIKIFSQRVGE